jgi:3',5'-cyclic AMP phosphodiesterase CpdA
VARRRDVVPIDSIAARRPLLLDPRNGDAEADASAPEKRSLLALAGNLFAEVSFPKLFYALLLLVIGPALILGIGPIVATLWLRTFTSTPRTGYAAILFLLALLIIGWIGGRPLFRVIENSFWSLNALAIQPTYVAFREGMLHLGNALVGASATEPRQARMRAAASALAGIAICALSLVFLLLVWPSTRWVGELADLRSPYDLVLPGLANAAAIALAYLAVAALWWGIADTTMPQPRELATFCSPDDLVRSWRVAHLSDVHVVGERFGFRLGSGRAGPRGNENFLEALRRLDDLHRREPLDAIVITGDLTDAGTSAEWGELLNALDAFPRLSSLMVAVPGNHDLNVVDRANPARLDLPTSPKKRLRQMRTVSVLDAIQGTRVHVADQDDHRMRDTVDHTFASHAEEVRAFANTGSRRLAKATGVVWDSAFPMILPPARDDGLGIIALNSNAETHFSFTNALGLVPAGKVYAIEAAMEQFPKAYWIIALHHHIVEHPKLGHALAERIGTTLINGNWFTRKLLRFSHRTVVMHGHRHIDWMGACGDLLILSAPSAVMPAKGTSDLYFYIHTVGVDGSGRLRLAEPQRVDVVS